YVTQIALPDRESGRMFYFKVPRINSPNYHNLYIYGSGLLNGLSGKAQMTVWTLWEELLDRRLFEETKHEDKERRRSMSDYSHMLARMREVVKPMVQRLEDVKAEFTGLRDHFFPVRWLEIGFGCAIDSLRELVGRAGDEPTMGETDLLYKRFLGAAWISDRPAIAYAVDTVFRKHSNPRMKVADIRRRVATFENKFLLANVDDSGSSVAREISRFKKDPERVRVMDELIEELLTSDWYVWPPETATDRDSQDEQTQFPPGSKN